MMGMQKCNSIIKKIYIIFCVNPFLNNKKKYTKLYYVSLFLFLLRYASFDFPPFPSKIEEMENMNGTLVGYGHCGRSKTCAYLESEGRRYGFKCVATNAGIENINKNIGKNVTFYYDRYGLLYRKMFVHHIVYGDEVIICYEYDKVLYRKKIFFAFGMMFYILSFIIMIYIFLSNRRFVVI